MSKTLGEKIKELRKELKLTQTELAGSEITKSMLSQIENNQATPSMKSLQYLSNRLSKPISYFIDDIFLQGSASFEEIYNKLKSITKLINERNQSEALIQLEALLKTAPLDYSSKLYADILSKYGECLVDLKEYAKGEETIQKAIDVYTGKYLYVDAAKSMLLLLGKYWSSFDYIGCMNLVYKALETYNCSISKDHAFEIEILYMQSIFYAGVNDVDGTISAIKRALDISKETEIYYKTDELYKNLGAINLFMDKHEDFEHYMEKARQYSVFIENNAILASIEGVWAMFYNKINNPNKALEKTAVCKQLMKKAYPVIYAQEVIAFYKMNKYSDALNAAAQVIYPRDYVPFKFDYLAILNTKIYEGLTLNKLGRINEGLAVMKEGIEIMETLGDSKILAFAYKSLSEIYSEQGDYENAFSFLKKSTTMEELTKSKKIYF